MATASVTEVTRLRGIITMIGIVRNRQVELARLGSGEREGTGLVWADGLVSLAGGGGSGHRCAARAVARLPGCGDAGRTELAGRCWPASGTSPDVLRATPAGRRRRQQERRPDRQASPSRRAGPATCDRSTARGEPIAVRRRLAYHPEQRAKSTESRSDSDRYLERADAMPGRLHPQPAQARPPVTASACRDRRLCPMPT